METEVLTLPRWNWFWVKQDRCGLALPEPFPTPDLSEQSICFTQGYDFFLWRMSWNRLLSNDTMSLKESWGNTRGSSPTWGFQNFLSYSVGGSWSSALPPLSTIPVEALVHLTGESWEGGHSEHLTATREPPFLLFSLVFDKQEGCLITESRLKWNFYLEPFTERTKFGLPLKKWKRVASSPSSFYSINLK